MDFKDLKTLLDCIECPVDLEPGQFYSRKGLVAKLDGFEFRVYSNDHDKHFHVVHLGRGINARFGFPNIELINYKSQKNIITSREKKNIKAFFSSEYYFGKLKREFDKKED